MNPVAGDRRDSEEYGRPAVRVKDFDLDHTPTVFRGENALWNGLSVRKRKGKQREEEPW